MSALTIHDLATELAIDHDDCFIIVDAQNHGSSSRWAQAFPSLTDEQHGALGDPFAIRFHKLNEGQSAFTRICQDVADAQSGLITGTITFIGPDWGSDTSKDDCPVRSLAFNIEGDDQRPVFTGGKLTFEAIPTRF